MNQLIVIALGGAFGAVMRFLVSTGLYQWLGRGFPYGTLLVNVVGSFLIGLLVQRINIYLVCQPKTPLNVTIYVYMMYSWWILTFGSITAVLGTNGIIFILFMPFLVKIFSKFNRR